MFLLSAGVIFWQNTKPFSGELRVKIPKLRNKNPKIEDKNPKVEDKNPKIEDIKPKIEDKNPIFFLQTFPKYVQNSKVFPDIYPEKMPKYLPLIKSYHDVPICSNDVKRTLVTSSLS